jgi:hypothetical protein
LLRNLPFSQGLWGFLAYLLLALPTQLHTFWQRQGCKIINLVESAMDDEPCRLFFRQPQQTFQRRYEALRAYFLDGRPLAEVAERFGYRMSGLKSMVCRFRAACARSEPPPFFFRTDADDPPVGDAVKIKTAPSHPPSPTPDC